MQNNSTTKSPRCKVCGQPLSDPTSVAYGIGPKCRGSNGGKMSKRARRYHKRHARSQAYTNRQPFTVGQESVPITPINEDEHGHEWQYGNDGFKMTHKELGQWLLRSQLM